ncbi:hypothetical protein B046DRAFT_03647 [Streptomyces sp. LamerLS-316]|uniref:effector-associated constant component EACC1 n=1 Tax=unclassified Streptomyces TaxID=2593676 RepID=UPI000823F623|nr:hypothetical protein [Streptomyces sp. LamerLS-316]MYQ38834.1 hypothetical protein [Streptomyces sp. SID4921]SCK39366.1 hypothetical protein B046DRAFT_03647 [Streptomyces sp. LamerLS-316]
MPTITFEIDSPADEAEAHTRSLATWFNDDEDLSGSARLRILPPARGEQGGFAEAVEIADAVGPALEAVISGAAVWLVQRARSRRVALKVTRPDGTSVEVSAGSPQDAAEIQRQLRTFLDPGTTDRDQGQS